jgi:uncharacterized protein YbcI
MSGTSDDVAVDGALTAAISTAMVSLLHSYTGRGPTRARTTIGENVIVCVMGAALTKGEQSLVADGTFMSNNHIDPDLAVEVFILEPR